MAFPERFLLGFVYHKVGLTNHWKPGGSTLRRLDPSRTWTGQEIRLASQTDRIIWIDVTAEEEAGQDIDDLSLDCEAKAIAEFHRCFPEEILEGPELTA